MGDMSKVARSRPGPGGMLKSGFDISVLEIFWPHLLRLFPLPRLGQECQERGQVGRLGGKPGRLTDGLISSELKGR